MRLPLRTGEGARLLGGTFVLALLILGGFYYFRSTANESRLRDRNLRDLARIGRTIEARVNNFESVLRNLATSEAKQEVAGNIPGLSVLKDECAGETPGTSQAVRLRVVRDELHFCYEGIHASWPLAEWQPTLSSAFFNELFVADAAGNVLLTSSDTSSLRLQHVPRSSSKRNLPRPSSNEETPRTDSLATSEPSNPKQNSLVESDVIVGGDTYVQLLQPVCISLAGSDRAAGGSVSGSATDRGAETEAGSCWTVGGLKSAEQFRAESLALESPHLVFLGIMVTLVVLAVPFLRARFMGPRERLR